MAAIVRLLAALRQTPDTRRYAWRRLVESVWGIVDRTLAAGSKKEPPNTPKTPNEDTVFGVSRG